MSIRILKDALKPNIAIICVIIRVLTIIVIINLCNLVLGVITQSTLYNAYIIFM